MTDEPKLTTQAVERAVDPATGGHRVRVRFEITEPDGRESEWSVWIPREEDFARAEDLARKELRRISAAVAAMPEPEAPPPEPEQGPKLKIKVPRKSGGWMSR